MIRSKSSISVSVTSSSVPTIVPTTDACGRTKPHILPVELLGAEMRRMQVKKAQRPRQNRKVLFWVLMPALLLFFPSRTPGQKLASSQVNAAETARHIAIRAPEAISADFVVPQNAVQALDCGHAQPL